MESCTEHDAFCCEIPFFESHVPWKGHTLDGLFVCTFSFSEHLLASESELNLVPMGRKRGCSEYDFVRPKQSVVVLQPQVIGRVFKPSSLLQVMFHFLTAAISQGSKSTVNLLPTLQKWTAVLPKSAKLRCSACVQYTIWKPLINLFENWHPQLWRR